MNTYKIMPIKVKLKGQIPDPEVHLQKSQLEIRLFIHKIILLLTVLFDKCHHD